MKTPPVLDRTLGRTEHIYWLLDQLYCLNFVAFAEVEGTLESAAVQAALDIVQRENPVLRARIVLDKKGQPRFQPVTAQERPLTLQVCALRYWRRQIEEQLMTPFEPNEAPLARFLWFRGKGKKSVVAMVFHHSIGDGKSGARVLFDVLSLATGDNSKPLLKNAQPSSQQLDLVKTHTPVQGKLKEIQFWLDTGRKALKLPEQLPGFDKEPSEHRKIKTLPFTLSAKTSAALSAICRDHNTTIHGALGAALLLAINSEFDRVKPRSLGLNSLADLRGVLTGGLTEQDLGLYITTLTTVHRLQSNPQFWPLAQDIPEQLRAIMNSGEANLINGIYTETALFTPDQAGARRVQKIVALAPPSSMLTNIGRIKEEPLGGALRICSLAFAVSPPAQHPVCVTAASYGGKMYLNLLYDQYKLEDDQAERITENMLDRLQQVAQGHQ